MYSDWHKSSWTSRLHVLPDPWDALGAVARGRALHPACPGGEQAAGSRAAWKSLKPSEDQNQGQTC